MYLATNTHSSYGWIQFPTQTDSDNPLLFIGKYILNQVDGDSYAIEGNKGSEVCKYTHIDAPLTQ